VFCFYFIIIDENFPYPILYLYPLTSSAGTILRLKLQVGGSTTGFGQAGCLPYVGPQAGSLCHYYATTIINQFTLDRR